MHLLEKPKSLLAALLLGGVTVGAHAAALNRSGAEYRILPSLPGDQTQVQLAFGAEGGFLVTQDNSIDGNGLGIRARRFYADLSAAQNTFQVNDGSLGDQQKPRVALLKDGGAVFAWQSSTAAGHRVMVRFLNSEDVFSTGDIPASRLAGGSQGDPVLAVLSNGNVIVIWAEWDRDGSMDGIFGQILTPSGARSGGTFQINEHSELSQRTPSVCALDNGGFVAAWVTDENREQLGFTDSNSIDIYARVFHADGTAAGAEFPANTWKTRSVKIVVGDALQERVVEWREVCANPALASVPGGFLAAWSERTSEPSTASWDVKARRFNLQGEALTDETVVNNVTQGDQFSPKIASAGSNQFIIWTSFGQDGSDEGIYGRMLTAEHQFEGDEFLVNTRTVGKQLFPAISAVGDGRFITAWSSFVGGMASYDVFAQGFALNSVNDLTAPNVPFVSSLGQNSVSVSWAEVTDAPGMAYLVYIDDEPAPTETTQGMIVVTRDSWAAGSTHAVRLAYKTAEGRISPASEPVTFKTWGADLNADGLPDDWQQLNFGKLRPGAKEDTDGDGASNYEELLAGTDPTDPGSVLRARISAREQGLYIEWNTVPGNYYQMQVTSDFSNWSNVGTPRFAHSEMDSLPCTGPGQVRYYRVIRMR